MEKGRGVVFIILLLHLFTNTLLTVAEKSAERHVYIVYFGEHTEQKSLNEIEETHISYLISVKNEQVEEAKSSLLYSYKHSINGFAALLSASEADELSGREEVVSLFKSEPWKYSLQTTRSWEFSGLDEIGEGSRLHPETGRGRRYSNTLRDAGFGRNVVVGVLDSGIWPESKSFHDRGIGPVPSTWKGLCQSGQNFNISHCNRKIIGARYYLKGYESYYGRFNRTLDFESPRDRDGHGTHTTSTIAGRRVDNVAADGGYARGTASGGAPLARVAVYKVCWAIPGHSRADGNTCFEEDILAAIDDAIADGVDVISISIGTKKPIQYNRDGIAIGSLHAVKRGIVVSCSAGNNGPAPGTLSNPAPWVITVAASSVDRKFDAPVLLGNGILIHGETVTPYRLNSWHPLVYAADVVEDDVPQTYIAGQCLPGSLSSEKVKDKIVFCLRGNGTRIGKGMEAKRAGAVGYILGNSPANGDEIIVDAHFLPATAVSSADAVKILEYVNSTRRPMATLVSPRTLLHRKPAPSMATFSSRGPNVIDSSILKPDITAPGLNIIAAWSEADSPTKLDEDHRVVKYNILSGTSMSCPHVSAAAALIKAIHPDWSSAAVRSALITTAGLMNNVGMLLTDLSGKPATPFHYGGGHFRPVKAADPGLIYDTSYEDYLLHLCRSGLPRMSKSFGCPDHAPPLNNLNYPSMAIPHLNGTVVFIRTVTNIGGKSVYSSSVSSPSGCSVQISPSKLSFERPGEKKRFSVTVKAISENKNRNRGYVFGWYSWNDGIHLVRSPMAVRLA